jgi:hypothetical protein
MLKVAARRCLVLPRVPLLLCSTGVPARAFLAFLGKTMECNVTAKPATGCRGFASSSDYASGVYGESWYAKSYAIAGHNLGIGLSGYLGSGAAVYGDASGDNAFAGLFRGTVWVTEYLSAKTILSPDKGFLIDHPQDPANKFLIHASVESPLAMNIYNGIAILDQAGTAMVSLPSYFDALNDNFRYQLTCIGSFAPVYIEQEILDNSFMIAGGTPGLKVSWQVTGTRADAAAIASRKPVESLKPPHQQGKYVSPEAFGKKPIDRINSVIVLPKIGLEQDEQTARGSKDTHGMAR